MPIHYFHGQDTYAAREHIDSMANQKNATIRWLDRDDFAENGAGQLLDRSGAGLFGLEIIAIRDPGNMNSGIQTEIVETLKKTGEKGECILWDRVEPQKKFKIYKTYYRRGKRFNTPSINELTKWLVNLADQKNVALNPQAANTLIERVGFNRWELASELEKLSLTRDKITAEDIKQTIPAPVQTEIFSILDALVQGNKKKALIGVKKILSDGNNEFYILSMLAYQFRVLYTIRSGIDQGKNPSQIAQDSSLKKYPIQKNWNTAKAKPSAFWRAAITRILATDFSIRQGKLDPKTAVLILTANLT